MRHKRSVEVFNEMIRLALGLSKQEWKALLKKRLEQEQQRHGKQAKKEAA